MIRLVGLLALLGGVVVAGGVVVRELESEIRKGWRR